MRTNHFLSPDVDLSEIAKLTPNFTGAEITGLLKSASSFAFSRYFKLDSAPSISLADAEKIRITREDLSNALDEVHASYGCSSEQLELFLSNGFCIYSKTVQV